jgi:mono/diheme cytochrome c family protein
MKLRWIGMLGVGLIYAGIGVGLGDDVVSTADNLKISTDSSLEVGAKKGEELFGIHCASCHQPGGLGLVGFAPAIRNPDFLALASDEFIVQSIQQGRPGTAMVGRPDLADDEVTAIVAYLRRWQSSASVKLDPLLSLSGSKDAGGEKFALYCAACHGPHGEGYMAGVPGTGIGLPGFLDVASDDYIFQTLSRGRINTPMRPFLGAKGLANLSDVDAHDIIAHLRHLGETYPERLANAPVGPGNAEAGKIHFNVNCSACHQVGGIGKVGFAPSIRNADFLAIATDGFIRQTIENGRAGTGMMARPDLPPQTVNDIIAYLRTDVPGAEETIVLDPDKVLRGDSNTGATTFATYCASCHGEKGEGYSLGVPGPGIGLPSFLASASDDYLFQTLKRGRRGTPMRPFLGASGLANLRETDLMDVIAHLRVLEIENAAAPSTDAGDDFE